MKRFRSDTKTVHHNIVQPYIINDSYSEENWLCRFRYLKSIQLKDDLIPEFELALKHIPTSCSIWDNYLKFLLNEMKERPLNDPMYGDVINTFERALTYVHPMPSVWKAYYKFSMKQKLYSQAEDIFERAFRCLSFPQHHKISPSSTNVTDIYKRTTVEAAGFRLSTQEPVNFEDIAHYLISIGELDEAALQLHEIVNDDEFVSKYGKTNYQLWIELCDLITKNPMEIKSINVDATIRDGLKLYKNNSGRMWNYLVDYYIRTGIHEYARDIYEEAIQAVTNEEDFNEVFDAYVELEKKILNEIIGKIVGNLDAKTEVKIEFDLQRGRLKNLDQRKGLLLNSLLLRENPYDVNEWHERVMLYQDYPDQIIRVYTDAVLLCQPHVATGKVYTLWTEFARFYENSGELERASSVYQKATEVPFTNVDDLATIWCEWADMECSQGNFHEALNVMHHATAMPAYAITYDGELMTVQAQLLKSLKIWMKYIDLQESYGTFQACQLIYNNVFMVNIAPPELAIRYGLFLAKYGRLNEADTVFQKTCKNKGDLIRNPNPTDVSESNDGTDASSKNTGNFFGDEVNYGRRENEGL